MKQEIGFREESKPLDLSMGSHHIADAGGDALGIKLPLVRQQAVGEACDEEGSRSRRDDKLVPHGIAIVHQSNDTASPGTVRWCRGTRPRQVVRLT
jgi:hypothetical protein